tara:strand:- start:205 stop:618 length:414 start_codon:yes stop_codon:yes gene_type:complete
MGGFLNAYTQAIVSDNYLREFETKLNDELDSISNDDYDGFFERIAESSEGITLCSVRVVDSPLPEVGTSFNSGDLIHPTRNLPKRTTRRGNLKSDRHCSYFIGRAEGEGHYELDLEVLRDHALVKVLDLETKRLHKL